MCSESSNSAKTTALSARARCIAGEKRGGAVYRVRINPHLRNVIEVAMIVDPHRGPDKNQKLLTSKGSPLAHAYHVWSTSVNAFVSYPAHRETT